MQVAYSLTLTDINFTTQRSRTLKTNRSCPRMTNFKCMHKHLIQNCSRTTEVYQKQLGTFDQQSALKNCLTKNKRMFKTFSSLLTHMAMKNSSAKTYLNSIREFIPTLKRLCFVFRMWLDHLTTHTDCGSIRRGCKHSMVLNSDITVHNLTTTGELYPESRSRIRYVLKKETYTGKQASLTVRMWWKLSQSLWMDRWLDLTHFKCTTLHVQSR